MNIASVVTKKVSGEHVTGLMVKSKGLSFLVEPTDMFVGRQLRFNGSYGVAEMHKIRKLVNEKSTVAFIGTHVGALAIPTAKNVKKAYFIEANPITFEYLETNITLNSIKNVKAFNCAVGEKEGEINFVLSKTNSGGSKREPHAKEEMYYYDKPNTVRVPMQQFDALTDGVDEKFDLVFIDIEGSEFFALKGMQNTLRRTENLVIEFISHHLKNVANVSVSEFVSMIEPYFQYLYVPTLEQYFQYPEFEKALTNMYNRGIDDDGIIFSKSKIDFS